jgi:chemotaxis signal transduction protein
MRDPTLRGERLGRQLRELRESYESALAAPRVHDRARGEPHALFEVAGSTFALRAAELGELRSAANMVRVPAAGAVIAGAIAHRQEIVQVIDLRALFELPERGGPAGLVLVLRPLALRTGVLCERMLGLQRVAPYAIARLDRPHALGHFVHGQRSVAVLRSEALVQDREPV